MDDPTDLREQLTLLDPLSHRPNVPGERTPACASASKDTLMVVRENLHVAERTTTRG